MTETSMNRKSLELRKRIIQYIKKAGAGHTGGSLSCLDILNVLYNEVMNVGPENFQHPDRDRYIQSKGHSVEALFVVLADKGFYSFSDLETLCQYQSHFIGHPTKKVPGIEQNTGALGHGLPLSVGTAIAGKMDKKDYKVFTLLGDGELLEGSNWEAGMVAAHYKLDNLVAILDYNKLQITGPVDDVLSSAPVADKWKAFGWEVKEVDGHDTGALSRMLKAVPFTKGKPSFIIAHTTKGKGVSFMENTIEWHHGVPNDEQYRQAMLELDDKLQGFLV